MQGNQMTMDKEISSSEVSSLILLFRCDGRNENSPELCKAVDEEYGEEEYEERANATRCIGKHPCLVSRSVAVSGKATSKALISSAATCLRGQYRSFRHA
jgi:hypothetical protein